MALPLPPAGQVWMMLAEHDSQHVFFISFDSDSAGFFPATRPSLAPLGVVESINNFVERLRGRIELGDGCRETREAEEIPRHSECTALELAPCTRRART